MKVKAAGPASGAEVDEKAPGSSPSPGLGKVASKAELTAGLAGPPPQTELSFDVSGFEPDPPAPDDFDI